MKNTEQLIKRTMKAVENHPLHTFWNVHKRSECKDIQFCEIRFENVDGSEMAFIFAHDEVTAIAYTDKNGGYKWKGSCDLTKTTADTFMMWVGIKLNELYEYVEEYYAGV